MRGRKTCGRRKGTPNKVTAEARAVCAAILDDPTYRTNLTARARAGTLAPAVEAMLWHYAFGKPKDSLDVTVGPAGDLSELSTEDLLHRADGPAGAVARTGGPRAGAAGRVSYGERVDLDRVGIADDVFAEALARGEQVEAVCRDWAAAA